MPGKSMKKVSSEWKKTRLVRSAKASHVKLSVHGKTRTKAQLVSAIRYAEFK